MKRKLIELTSYYHTTRQVGHTTLMRQGTDNFEDKKLVLVVNTSHGKDLRIPKDEMVTLNSLVRLRGQHRPLIIDNGALMTIFDDTLNEVRYFEHEKDVEKIRAGMLQKEINTMRKQPFKTLFKTLWQRW